MINQITLVGRLVNNLEYKDIGEGRVYKGKIAVDEYVGKTDTNPDGKHTSFIFFETWRPGAQYILKGDLFGLTGSYRVKELERDGNRSYFHIVVAKEIFLFPKKVNERIRAESSGENPNAWPTDESPEPPKEYTKPSKMTPTASDVRPGMDTAPTSPDFEDDEDLDEVPF